MAGYQTGPGGRDGRVAPRALFGQTDAARLVVERGYPQDFSGVGAGLGRMDLVRAFFDEEGGGSDGLPANERAQGLATPDEVQRRMNCAFLVAAINGQTEVIADLLDRGLDVNLQPPGSDFAGIGATALHWAARRGHPDAVQILLGRGADPNLRDDVYGLIPADWAGWGGHREVRDVLVRGSGNPKPRPPAAV